MTSIHAPFTTEVECKMASFTHVENFGVHAPRLIRIDAHDPVRVSLETPLKYGPELQLGIMQLEREGSPPPGLRLPQAKLSRKSNQVARGRIRRFESYMPSQPVRHGYSEQRRSSELPGGCGRVIGNRALHRRDIKRGGRGCDCGGARPAHAQSTGIQASAPIRARCSAAAHPQRQNSALQAAR